MSATTVTSPRGVVTPPRRSFVIALADGWAITGRNVIVYRRVPTLVVFTLIQPVVFVLLFRYVFGGAIRVPGGIPYVDYLMPGIFVQTVAFGATNTAIGLATDVKSGLLERFIRCPWRARRRSPAAPSPTSAATCWSSRSWRSSASPSAFACRPTSRASSPASPWCCCSPTPSRGCSPRSAWAIGDPESAQAVTFPVLAPVVFASSVFVPVSTMPGWLQGWAKYQPVSATANAARALMLWADRRSRGCSSRSGVRRDRRHLRPPRRLALPPYQLTAAWQVDGKAHRQPRPPFLVCSRHPPVAREGEGAACHHASIRSHHAGIMRSASMPARSAIDDAGTHTRSQRRADCAHAPQPRGAPAPSTTHGPRHPQRDDASCAHPDAALCPAVPGRIESRGDHRDHHPLSHPRVERRAARRARRHPAPHAGRPGAARRDRRHRHDAALVGAAARRPAGRGAAADRPGLRRRRARGLPRARRASGRAHPRRRAAAAGGRARALRRDRHDRVDLGARDGGDRPRQGPHPPLARRAGVPHGAAGAARRSPGRARRLAVAAHGQTAHRLGGDRRASRRRSRRPRTRARRRRRRAGDRPRPGTHGRCARAARRAPRRRRAASPHRRARRRGRKGRDRTPRRPRGPGPRGRRGTARRLWRAQHPGVRRPAGQRDARDRAERPVRRRLPARLPGRRPLPDLDDRGAARPSLHRRRRLARRRRHAALRRRRRRRCRRRAGREPLGSADMPSSKPTSRKLAVVPPAAGERQAAPEPAPTPSTENLAPEPEPAAAAGPEPAGAGPEPAGAGPEPAAMPEPAPAPPPQVCLVFDIDDTLILERDYVRSGFEAAGLYAKYEYDIGGLSTTCWSLSRPACEATRSTAPWRCSRSRRRPASSPSSSRSIVRTAPTSSCSTTPRPVSRAGATAPSWGSSPTARLFSQRAKIDALELGALVDLVVVTAEASAAPTPSRRRVRSPCSRPRRA